MTFSIFSISHEADCVVVAAAAFSLSSGDDDDGQADYGCGGANSTKQEYI